jgi:SAM-dependent methyltransferase
MTASETKRSHWTTIDRCPLCSASQSQLVYNSPDRHYGIQGKFDIYKCQQCELVFLNPMPDDSALTDLYPTDYYSYQNFDSNSFFFKLKKVLINILFLGRGTSDPAMNLPCKFLDVGCGTGRFMFDAKRKGWECYGVEVSQDAAKLGQQEFDLNIFNGTLLEASFPSESFDYIRLNHSLEHIYNPNETIDEIYRLLKPKGKLLIGVPNIDGLNARIFGEYWWYLCPPVHTFNYSTNTLAKMLEKHRFIVDRVRYNSNFAGIFGSILLLANRKSGKLTRGAIENNLFLLPLLLSHYISKIIDLFQQGDAIEITCTKN